MNSNQSNIGAALFTKTQQRVLGLLYGQTDKSFYMNEIVRLADMGKGTVRRELDKLMTAGLLTINKQGNQNHYQANAENPIYTELQSIVKKTFGVVGVLNFALHTILPIVDYAFVYGSVAKGTEHASSDIDLMLVAEDLSYTDLMEALSIAEKQLGRSINPTIYNKQEMHKRIKQKQSFITRVLSQNMLWLKGESHFKEIYNKEFK
jgi:predicted nucleotidyltransferase